jgi:hypothetical protein
MYVIYKKKYTLQFLLRPVYFQFIRKPICVYCICSAFKEKPCSDATLHNGLISRYLCLFVYYGKKIHLHNKNMTYNLNYISKTFLTLNLNLLKLIPKKSTLLQYLLAHIDKQLNGEFNP